MNNTTHFLAIILISSLLGLIVDETILSEDRIIYDLSSRLSVEQITSILDLRDKWSWLNYLLLPVIYLVKFFLITSWLLCGSIIFGFNCSFKELLRVVIISEYVWVFSSVLTIIWFGFVRTDYNINEIQHFQPLALINLFNIDNLDKRLIFPLKALNIFELIYAGALAVGIQKLIKVNLSEAVRFSILVYGPSLITWLVFITFLGLNLAE